MDQGDSSESARPRAADVAGVPDAALRSALEFAVAIAAAGQKVRPPLVYPSSLKPYLKSNRLDAAALRTVRRAIVADEPFRDRLGLVDSSELVDALGAAWLRRADGWEDDVHRLLTAAREQAAEASAEAALRKSEKRREAAEQATARANAELIGHHEALARESNRREKAEQQARDALAQVTGLGEQVTGLRREVDRLRSKLETESARAAGAESEVAAAGERLAAVEQIRDSLLAQRNAAAHSSPGAATRALEPRAPEPQANAQAARALQQAAAATRDLAAALAAAGDALGETPCATSGETSTAERGYGRDSGRAPATARHNHAGLDGVPGVKQIRPRPERRRPIPIPGGVYGNSVAAAEHMFRVPGVRVIVDGYNLAKLAWPQLELIDQRECCIDLLEDLVRRLGTDIRVVFDGADVVGASSGRRLIPVRFSPPGVSADDVIRDDVRALPERLPVVVVTNDQAIVTDVRAAGVNVVATDTLLALAGRGVPR